MLFCLIQFFIVRKKDWDNLILLAIAIAIGAVVSNYNYIKNNQYKLNKNDLYKIDSINTLLTEIQTQKGRFVLFEDYERRKYIISKNEFKLMGNRGGMFKNASLVFDILTDKEGLQIYKEKNTSKQISVYDVIVSKQSLISIDEINNLRHKQATSTYFYIIIMAGIFIPFFIWKKMNADEKLIV